ncbi:MAG: EamA family transporter [Candidatus Marsarchaeota archaeon]|nr:EamA family transporter [Candidatus Marsarchaeota archaeon]
MTLTWYYLVIISAALMSTATLVEKFALKNEHASVYSSDATLLIAVASLLLIPFANFHITAKELLVMYLLSLTSTTTYLLTARTYKHGDVSAASPILSTLPSVFTVLLAFIFLGESLRVSQYIFIIVLVALTYLLLFRNGRNGIKYFERMRYINYLIITSLLMAVGAILMKYVLDLGVSIFTLFVVLGLSIAFNMAVYMTFKYGGVREMTKNLMKHPAPLTTIAVLTLFYRLTYYAAASVAFISIVSPLRQGATVAITVMLGAIIFKEHDLVRKMALAVMMVVCIYFVINPLIL